MNFSARQKLWTEHFRGAVGPSGRAVVRGMKRRKTMLIMTTLLDVANAADLALTTAGISVGDEHHVRESLLDPGGDPAVLTVAMVDRS